MLLKTSFAEKACYYLKSYNTIAANIFAGSTAVND
jgi:hypothetical protein